jgi:hypothetical protein
MLREPFRERILTRLAKPTFDEVIRKDDEDAISVSTFVSKSNVRPDRSPETNRDDEQVVGCQVEQLVVLCASLFASPKLEFVASFRENKSQHLGKRLD